MKDTDKYVEEKAERFMFKCPGFPMGDTRAPYLLKDLIRQVVRDCKPRVSRKFIKECGDAIWKMNFVKGGEKLAEAIVKMAGFEVDE